MVNQRRKFIKNIGALATTSLLPFSGFPITRKKKYKMGLQLYTVRDAMKMDPIGSLKKIHELGYEDLEVYGYDADNASFYGYKASDFKTLLEDCQLTASSGHYNFSDYFDKPLDSLKKYVDKCIFGAHTLNKPYITWPWLAPEFRSLDNFKILAEKLNIIGEQVVKSGLGFAYHNHGFEFTEYNGQTGYDIILKETDAKLVKLQMDLYWVLHSSKKSPSKLIAQNPGRYVMWHIKDMDKISRDYTELGNGSIDYKTMLPELSKDGLDYYYLEQGGNFAQNSMQSITDSSVHFKKHLQQYL